MVGASYPQRSPRKRPTVGAGSSQREDSPAHRPLYAQTTHGAQRFLSRHGKGGHAALVREGTRCARHLPYQERNSQSRKLIEMRFPAVTSQKRRIATVSERLNCVIETSLPVRNAPYKRLTPYGPLAAVPFGIRWFKTYSPVPRRT